MSFGAAGSVALAVTVDRRPFDPCRLIESIDGAGLAFDDGDRLARRRAAAFLVADRELISVLPLSSGVKLKVVW